MRTRISRVVEGDQPQRRVAVDVPTLHVRRILEIRNKNVEAFVIVTSGGHVSGTELPLEVLHDATYRQCYD